jgi:hypothetical protein
VLPAASGTPERSARHLGLAAERPLVDDRTRSRPWRVAKIAVGRPDGARGMDSALGVGSLPKRAHVGVQDGPHAWEGDVLALFACKASAPRRTRITVAAIAARADGHVIGHCFTVLPDDNTESRHMPGVARKSGVPSAADATVGGVRDGREHRGDEKHPCSHPVAGLSWSESRSYRAREPARKARALGRRRRLSHLARPLISGLASWPTWPWTA